MTGRGQLLDTTASKTTRSSKARAKVPSVAGEGHLCHRHPVFGTRSPNGGPAAADGAGPYRTTRFESPCRWSRPAPRFLALDSQTP
jgi:hypothetical protein